MKRYLDNENITKINISVFHSTIRVFGCFVVQDQKRCLCRDGESESRSHPPLDIIIFRAILDGRAQSYETSAVIRESAMAYGGRKLHVAGWHVVRRNTVFYSYTNNLAMRKIRRGRRAHQNQIQNAPLGSRSDDAFAIIRSMWSPPQLDS